MKDLKNVIIAYLFLVAVTFPVTIELYNSYGSIVAFILVLAPLLWFVIDSKITHYSMDKFLKE